MASPTNMLPNLQQSTAHLSSPCTLQSEPHITEEPNIAPSSPINMVSVNQVSELFSVPISYEMTKNTDGFLSPSPREQDHAKHATATWEKILSPSKISCKVIYLIFLLTLLGML